MPRRLMDNLKGEVIDEEFHKRALGYDKARSELSLRSISLCA